MNRNCSVLILFTCLYLIIGLSFGSEVKEEIGENLLEYAIDLYQRGDYNASFEAINHYLIDNGENASALNLRGLLYMNNGSYEFANEDFHKALTHNGNESILNYNLGLNSFYLGDMISADIYFNKARALGYSSFDLLFYSGLVKYGKGSYTEAAELLQNATIKNPNDSATWFNLGMAYEQIKKFDLAVHAYDEAIRLDPSYEKPWFFKGRIYHSFGNSSLAQMAFHNYTTLEPRDDLGWFFYAKSLHDGGKNNESVQALEEALKINPSNQMYLEFLNAYVNKNETSFNEVITSRLSEDVTILILSLIGIISILAIFRR